VYTRTTSFVLFIVLLALGSQAFALSHPDKEFKIFQFPQDRMPRIDGDISDWDIVPASYVYGSELVNDTVDGNGVPDPKDLELTVKVGWVKGLNRLYFLYEAYDDVWDFTRYNPRGYSNDIFEIAVDADLSGGQFINNPVIKELEGNIHNYLAFSGRHAQNYHFFTPPIRNSWVLVWGGSPWVGTFPYSNWAYDYDFQQGEDGKLVFECWITCYDYAPPEGPAAAIESNLVEDSLIGLSWSILDFDGGKREGHYNLAHNVRMVSDGSYLCGFRLMPIEAELRDPIEAEWEFKVVDMESGLVAFKDLSYGNITRWEWDFGDGSISTEQNPLHRYEPGIRYVITLTVSGPEGTDQRARHWEVLIDDR
jgi:hypothetical protein